MDKWLVKKPYPCHNSSLRSSSSPCSSPSLKSPSKMKPNSANSSSNNSKTTDRFFKNHKPASETAYDIVPVRLELDYDDDAASVESPSKKRVGKSESEPKKRIKTNGDSKKKKKAESIPDQEYPDPLSREGSDHWVTELQFLREKVGGVDGLLDNFESLAHPPRPDDLNIEQRQVVGASPAVPLSVRAGAGTGKTSTMVERAVSLVTQHGLQADRILMVTFSNKAAAELRERVRPAFRGISTRLPTTKTFHGLAYAWLRRYYKAAGFSRRPTILATTSQRSTVMELAIEATIDRLRLEICCRNLNLAESSTWDDVLLTYQGKFEDFSANKKSALSDAKKQVHQNRKASSDGIKEDISNRAMLLLRYECYLRLIKVERPKSSDTPDDGKKKKLKKKAKDDVLCPIERRFSAPTDLIKLLDDSRTNKHELEEYLPRDAMACRMYLQLQLETCQVDFDSLLHIFAETLMSHTAVVERFRDSYRYTIVDEYQDNSEAQADLLRKIVHGGSCTVVGDDDQTIYGFRGASPGNFDRLRKWYLEERNVVLNESTLSENYRSSANILAVATRFLENSHDRHPKPLNPTKEAGLPVEVWHCRDKEGQSRRIVSSIIERHVSGGITYGEMAILLRCSKMGALGCLSTALQVELFARNIPFVLVGGTSLFERETVLDLLAYLRLALGEDDDAMKRVINKPPRKLPADVMIPLIEHHRVSSGRRGTLQQAAKAMCKTGASLSASRHSALERFMSELDELRKLVDKMPLPSLIMHIWKVRNAEGRSLQDFHENKSKAKKSSGKDDKKTPNITRVEGATFQPTEVRVFAKLAQKHVDEWIEREKRISNYEREGRGSKTLVERARDVVSANMNDIDLDGVPSYIRTEVILAPLGLGKSVVAEFLANAALEKTGEGDEEPDCEGASGKVSISTIHRAKGLEWNDVYVPFFNQGFLPTLYRPSQGSERHRNGCHAREGGLCNMKCADWFSNKDRERSGSTPEERHLSEERRLAHVAATRAKERLVFTCIKSHNRFGVDAPKKSDFLAEIKPLVVETT